MFQLLAQVGQSAAPIVNVNAPSSNPWPAVIGTLAGALIGAFAGVCGHIVAHGLTSRRERDQRLRAGYADFAAAAYRYISHSYQLKHSLDRLGNMAYSIPGSPEEADHQHDNEAVARSGITQTVKDRGESLDEMVAARSRLILLLGNDDRGISEIQEVSEQIILDDDKDKKALLQTRVYLDNWLTTTAGRLSG